MFGALALAVFALIATALLYLRDAATTTVILVRHAEKQLGTIDNPPLTSIGEERAERLAQLFADDARYGRIDAIYVSDTRRSQQTAAPLARRVGLVPMVSAEQPPGLARTVLRAQRGHRVLIVGHSNTIPALVAELSGTSDVPPMGDDEYSTIYIVAVPAVGAASVLRARY